MQRGHKGCTSTGTDVRADGTVKVRVGHVIDRGRRRGTVHKGILFQSWYQKVVQLKTVTRSERRQP